MINYYVFDRIEKDEFGCYWGTMGEDVIEVFPRSSEDTESDLIENGFALCDAPGTETFIVEESAISDDQWVPPYSEECLLSVPRYSPSGCIN